MSDPAYKIGVAGKWVGMVCERNGAQYKFQLILEVDDISNPEFPIRGAAEVLQDEPKYPMVMTGRFLDGTDFIQLDYTNKDPGVIHFGTIFLKLSREATELGGEFVTLSPVDECLISGTVSLVKEHA